MTSVSRMQEYASLPPEEGFNLNSDLTIPLEWPADGQICFQRAVMRYRPDLEPALKEISLEIEGGMKVGVVGRTGAGKSSLVHALLRLTNCDPGTGVAIDGRSTKHVGLRRLRQAISVIPQTPFLFEGTLR